MLSGAWWLGLVIKAFAHVMKHVPHLPSTIRPHRMLFSLFATVNEYRIWNVSLGYRLRYIVTDVAWSVCLSD